MGKLYNYEAIVKYIYDGDTITLDIDLGMDTWVHNCRIRLHGIDAPELRGEERPQGLVSRDWLRDRLPIGSKVQLVTVKDKKGKYGRYLGIIGFDGININVAMVNAGHAVFKEY